MNAPTVTLRPVAADDLPMLERFCVEPELMGLDWQGFRDRGAIGRRFAEDGFLGEKDGQLIVTADGHAAGFVAWRAFSYGRPEHACWNIGIILLPEWRGRGLGRPAQRHVAAVPVPFTPHVPVRA